MMSLYFYKKSTAMSKYSFLPVIFLLTFIFMSAVSFSQATRTWVSGVGDDVNPCSRTAPCKTFAGAISKTAAGGEINVIDPAGYGAVTITKSMTIDGKGAMASILSSGTNGIIINGADAVVTIRNISINGAGNGINGIRIIAAKKVFIEDCVIAGFTQKAIEVNTTAPCAVMLNNVTVHNAYDAIAITNEGGAVAINNCRFQTLTNAGINLLNGQVTLSHSNIADCRTAVVSAAKTSISLADNVICNNDTAFQAAGTINSGGNNLVSGNKVQGTAMTLVKLQ
jgi:Right handed beta helix region